MELKGKITILISREGTTIEIEDENSNTRFVKVFLTPEQLSAVLSRQASVECELKVVKLERVGKKHENKSFEFEIDKEKASSSNTDELYEIAKSKLSDGWIPDKYFSSQNSFYKKDGKQYANCTIRRWI